jgi:hypothetical protein
MRILTGSWKTMIWKRLNWLNIVPIVEFCVQGHEPLGSIKREFLDQLGDFQTFKKVFIIIKLFHLHWILYTTWQKHLVLESIVLHNEVLHKQHYKHVLLVGQWKINGTEGKNRHGNSLEGSPESIIIIHTIIYRQKLYLATVCSSQHWPSACLPAWLMPLPSVCDPSHHAGCKICEHEALCQPASPCRGKPISASSTSQIPPHLARYVCAKFCFHQLIIARFIIFNAGPLWEDHPLPQKYKRNSTDRASQ